MLKTRNPVARDRARPTSPPVALPGAAHAMLARGVDPSDERMLLNYANIEAMLVQAHQLGDTGPATVAPRLTYLQRLGFPAGTRPGRGTKSRYGIEDVLKIAIAFELLQIGIQPTRAVRLVATDWRLAARALAEAARAGAGTKRGGPARLIAFKADALAEPAAKDGGLGQPLPDAIGTFAGDALASRMDARERHVRRYILLDATGIMDAVVPALAALPVTDAHEVAREIELFAASALAG